MSEADRRLAARRRLWQEATAGWNFAGKTVLDAGTGEGHFTKFLVEQSPVKLVSITCRDEEIEPARKVAGDPRLAFRVADLTAMPEFPSATFDFVGGDFLIAALSACAPFRERDAVAELVRVLKPGGRLLLTGWEVDPTPRNLLDESLRELFRFRAAVQLLVGVAPFREHPAAWVERCLADLGLPHERTIVHPDIHHGFRWFGKQVRQTLDDVPLPLRPALADHWDRLEAPVLAHPAWQTGFVFGRLWAVTACKLEGGVLMATSPQVGDA